MKCNTPKQGGGTIVWSDEALDAFETFMQVQKMEWEKRLYADENVQRKNRIEKDNVKALYWWGTH